MADGREQLFAELLVLCERPRQFGCAHCAVLDSMSLRAPEPRCPFLALGTSTVTAAGGNARGPGIWLKWTKIRRNCGSSRMLGWYVSIVRKLRVKRVNSNRAICGRDWRGTLHSSAA